MAWLIPLGAVLAIAALLGWRYFNGRREHGYLSVTEYWVYTSATQLPEQEKLMDRMISSNPHNRRGFACIGAKEGMLFTDIRLHLGVALKAKNPHIFRPDLFEEHAVPTKEILERLSECPAMVKVRYVSEARIRDTRHLQFLPHMADAVAELTDGQIVFDHVSEQFWTAEDFREMLAQNGNCERPEFHVRVAWRPNADGGGYAETLGLRKIGIPEFRTQEQESDKEVLVTGLLMRLAFQLVRDFENSDGPWEFEEFDDTFIFQPAKLEDGKRIVELTRRQVLG